MTEIPVSIGAMRIAAVVIGLIVFLVAWNTRDRMWSIWYWLDRLRGGQDHDDAVTAAPQDTP